MFDEIRDAQLSEIDEKRRRLFELGAQVAQLVGPKTIVLRPDGSVTVHGPRGLTVSFKGPQAIVTAAACAFCGLVGWAIGAGVV